jgi:predicted ATPase
MAAKTGHNLPAATTSIVGRDSFIDLVESEVKGARLVSIVGAGGIGKTTVALAMAERAIESYSDGVWLVDFAPLRDPALVGHSIANVTGLAVHSADALPALCRFLRNRRMLLVLDNCEHMIEAIAFCVGQILAEAPGVRILSTSRAALGVEGEHVHRLPGLETPAAGTAPNAETALQYSAVQLFVDRARDRVESFVLTDADAPAVADICRSLDGIALAIELAAMRVDVFGVSGLQKQLDDRFRLLAGRRAGLERHRTMAATLDWSYGLLPEREASLLRTVSVFAGAFHVEDASAAFDVAPEDAAGFLHELASQSLLTVDEESARATYRPLESTRAYCLAKLAETGLEAEVRLRHAQYICDVLERAAREWMDSQSRDWGGIHGRYLDDLRAALAWLGANPAHRSLLIRLTTAATPLWNHFSLTDESRSQLTRAISELKDAGSAGTEVEMKLQLMLAGALLFTRGNVPEVPVAVRRALHIANGLGDTAARLQCLRIMGTYELFSGQPDAGIRTLELFLSIASNDDPLALPEGETHLGVGEMFAGRLSPARQRLEGLYAHISQDFNDKRFAQYQYSNSVNVMIVLSHAQWLTGSPDAAELMMTKVVEYARQAEHELSFSIGLAWACLLFQWAGREDDCERHAIMLDELCERHGIVMWKPIAIFCRGAVAASRPDSLAASIGIMERAVVGFRAIGHVVRLPYCIAVLADALARQGRMAEASDRIGEALDLAYKQNERWCLPEVIRIQAVIALAQGKAEAAEALLLDAISAADEIGALTWRLRASNDLAQLWRTQSRTDDALRVLKPALDAVSGLASRDIMIARETLAQLQ